jgi:hypothetical protein
VRERERERERGGERDREREKGRGRKYFSFVVLCVVRDVHIFDFRRVINGTQQMATSRKTAK